jgi:hypothetical protein
MQIVKRLLLFGLSVFLIASCAHVPRSPDHTPEMTSIRQQYLADNPDGAYNAYIQRGEVVKGMNVVEVLASWGPPDSRHGVHGSSAETWSYEHTDDVNREFMVYELVFKSRTLARWAVSRQDTGSGTVSRRERTDVTRTEDPGDRIERRNTNDSGAVLKKKR